MNEFITHKPIGKDAIDFILAKRIKPDPPDLEMEKTLKKVLEYVWKKEYNKAVEVIKSDVEGGIYSHRFIKEILRYDCHVLIKLLVNHMDFDANHEYEMDIKVRDEFGKYTDEYCTRLIVDFHLNDEWFANRNTVRRHPHILLYAISHQAPSCLKVLLKKTNSGDNPYNDLLLELGFSTRGYMQIREEIMLWIIEAIVKYDRVPSCPRFIHLCYNKVNDLRAREEASDFSNNWVCKDIKLFEQIIKLYDNHKPIMTKKAI